MASVRRSDSGRNILHFHINSLIQRERSNCLIQQMFGILTKHRSHITNEAARTPAWGLEFRISDRYRRLGCIVTALTTKNESLQPLCWADFTMNMRSNDPPLSCGFNSCGRQGESHGFAKTEPAMTIYKSIGMVAASRLRDPDERILA